jgi:prophage regulatory protein
VAALPRKFIMRRDLRPYTTFGDTELMDKVHAGEFPQPVKLGPRRIGWILDEVIAWQDEKIAARDRAFAGIPRDSADEARMEERPRWKKPG